MLDAYAHAMQVKLCKPNTQGVTIGSPKGVTLLKFEPEHQEEQQAAQEQEIQAEGGVNLHDLPKCPDYQSSSFLKGKPQSIIILLYFYKYYLHPLCLMHLVIGVGWKHLLHIFSLSRQIYLESFVGLGSNICLALLSPVEVR